MYSLNLVYYQLNTTNMRLFLLIFCFLFSYNTYSQNQTIELCDGNQRGFTYSAIGTPNCNYTWELYLNNKLQTRYLTETIDIEFKTPGEYLLKAQIENTLCESDVKTYTISVIPCRMPAVYIPTSFTPNGDGVNDLYTVKGVYIDEYIIEIYNRWGQLFYTSTDIKEYWDGTINGIPVPTGAYVYLVRYRDVFGYDGFEYGTVTLYR